MINSCLFRYRFDLFLFLWRLLNFFKFSEIAKPIIFFRWLIKGTKVPKTIVFVDWLIDLSKVTKAVVFGDSLSKNRLNLQDWLSYNYLSHWLLIMWLRMDAACKRIVYCLIWFHLHLLLLSLLNHWPIILWLCVSCDFTPYVVIIQLWLGLFLCVFKVSKVIFRYFTLLMSLILYFN